MESNHGAGVPVKTAATPASVKLAAADTAFIGPQLPPPAVPLTPEKQAPMPPRISFQNGLLTLESTNSRLGDILNGVRTKANIQFEGLEPASERVAVKLGPAPADEVLGSLLQGSRFNYIILSHPENPHTVERVLLSAKGGVQGEGGVGQPSAAPRPSDEATDEASEEDTVETPLQSVQQPLLQQPVVLPSIPSPGIPTPEELANRVREEQQKQGIAGPNNTAPLKRRSLPQ
ncbi:MAG TPA: hypothetical protein VNW97_20385 [Candidatus Saccharimonadales bacterium]|nr:hypothetical protein [Candidatus Saccharimonadales bacterium]